jgi:hypothetical protein
MSEPRRFIAYEIYDRTEIALTSAPVHRDWMDASPNRSACHCLPLVIANQAGWFIHCAVTFTAVWDGGPEANNVRVVFESGRPMNENPWAFTVDSLDVSEIATARNDHVSSHFGVGTITFRIPFLFRTPPGINLWVKGPSNWIKDGVHALEGIVEADWVPATFTMNWKLTRPHHPVRFEKGEPICMLVPIPRGLGESLEPVRRPLNSEPALEKEFEDWSRSREQVIKNMERREPETAKRGWQHDYVRGVTRSGAKAPEHQTRLNLKEFVKEQ